MLNNNQYWGCKEQRALFGVLGIAILEAQIGVKLSFQEKEPGTYKDKSHKFVKALWKELSLILVQERDICS